MPLKVWDGSTFKQAQSLRVWNGSSWAAANSAHVWNGSEWKMFYPALRADDATIGDAAFTSGTAIDVAAKIQFNTDGTVDYLRTQNADTTNVYSWVLPEGNASIFYIRAITLQSPTNGATLSASSSWQLATSNVLYQLFWNNLLDGSDTAQIRVELSKDQSTVLESGVITFNVSVSNIGGG